MNQHCSNLDELIDKMKEKNNAHKITNSSAQSNQQQPQSQTSSTNSGNKSGFNISLNATEILKLLITEHFWTTVLMIFGGALIYLAIHFDYDFIGAIKNGIIGVDIHLIAVICASSTLGVGLFLGYKLTKIAQMNEVNRLLTNALYDEFKSLQTLLSQYQSKFSTIAASTSMLSDLISENIIDVRKTLNILKSINNTIKRIPDKNTIEDILTIRTRLLFGSIVEILSEYLSAIVVVQPGVPYLNQSFGNTSVVSISRSKQSFIEGKMRNKLDEIKAQYIDEIYHLSKNTIDDNIREDIAKLLNTSFNQIVSLVFNIESQTGIDEMIYNINLNVKQLTIDLINLYNSNLVLTSFLEEGNAD